MFENLIKSEINRFQVMRIKNITIYMHRKRFKSEMLFEKKSAFHVFSRIFCVILSVLCEINNVCEKDIGFNQNFFHFLILDNITCIIQPEPSILNMLIRKFNLTVSIFHFRNPINNSFRNFVINHIIGLYSAFIT
ncbi:hypothetical protein BpHYR1_042177 [Brachionus plicatilis]|uniref:Uncharacterized protein n=1 Tax=Brachionus plicatilis TaxID=10195 RepID=A0A3M7SF64_BRAPC|nr:hypothetical protein BpHYR1_042177 [Brachionus plicatilis]